MNKKQSEALIAFAQSVHESYAQLGRMIETLLERVDGELAEVRDGIIAVDHSKVSRREYEQLHSRVDTLEALRGDLRHGQP